ncbi:MAG: EamA family transporter [Chitinophagales bacterium]|nr:EamA family transporter [Chitinophagales bacterium]
MLIFILFKKYKVDTFHAIVINYTTAALVGFPLVKNWDYALSIASSWLPFAVLLGTLFIGLFFLIGLSTQRMGVSVTTVAMKLGYIFPILFAFTLYKEPITSIKVIAIILTILAVVLSSIKKKENEANAATHYGWLLALPIIIFVGSGICDSVVQYTQKVFFPQEGAEAFTIALFITSATVGWVAAIIHDIKKGKWNFNKKNIVAGILLGIPNYGSIYFLFKALSFYKDNSAMVFPINNVGIVVLSTLLAMLIFSEKLSKLNWFGFALAVLSILLMSYENFAHLF